MEIATQKATFAAGCFWGVEDAFRKIGGVLSTRVGYIGGLLENPGYIKVLSGKTGHAEAVEVTFDPSIVTFDELLATFWSIHDPTLTHRELVMSLWNIHDPSTLDNLPNTVSHYRSSIFYHNDDQKSKSIKFMEEMERRLGRGKRILTEIVPVTTFYQAEEEHQQYAEKNTAKDKVNMCSLKNCPIK
jgi:peptide-methionine (S)-S-oxide reductase